MFAFAIGFAVVHVALLAWSIVAQWDWARSSDGFAGRMTAELVVMPVAAVLIGADLVHRVRPCRAFDLRVRRNTGELLVRGFIVGILSVAGIVAAVTAVAALDGAVPEPLIVTLVPGAIGAAMVVMMPRCRPGHCVQCGYDLRGCHGAARCPECGAFGSTAHVRRRGRSGPPPLRDRHAPA